ncbi:MAG: type II secretion system protein GspG [Phycisphaerales bacterium]
MRAPLALIALAIALASADAADPYIRTTERDGGVVALETASRVFEDDAGRRVTLVGVTHVGDAPYYEELEDLLNEHERVHYEGVGPAWRDIASDASDRDRARFTRARMRDAAAELLSGYRSGGRARTAEAWLESYPPFRRRTMITAMTDGWGNPITLDIDTKERTYTFTSLGADGEPGGAGADADFERTGDIRLGNERDPAEDAIQSRLAEAAGLAFQLDEMDYMPESWHNSDATLAELFGVEPGAMLGDLNADPAADAASDDPLFAMLSGESGIAKVIGSVLGVIGNSPRSSFMFRVMLVELLGGADASVLAAGLGDEMADMLLHRRNQIVIDDVRDAFADDPALRSLAVFYGAAHLDDLDERIRALGFEPVGTTWHAAITADPADVGIEPEQAAAFRTFVSSMVQMQMAQMREMQQRDD